MPSPRGGEFFLTQPVVGRLERLWVAWMTPHPFLRSGSLGKVPQFKHWARRKQGEQAQNSQWEPFTASSKALCSCLHLPSSALVEGNTNSVVTLSGHRVVGKEMVFTSFFDGLALQSPFTECCMPYYCSHCWPGGLPS